MNTVKINTVCEMDQCNGCMACHDICHKNAITIVDNHIAYNAVIDDTLCVGCHQCEKVCPNIQTPVLHQPIEWHQGWAADETIRSSSSSGGIATALATAFVQNGGKVCSCVMESGEFRFELVDKAEDVKRFSGSKYVKSNPVGAYRKIKKELSGGHKVLFVGLPCQVAAVKNYMGENDLLYTVDLICHGTPSPQLLDMYLKENKSKLQTITDLKFRKKTTFKLSENYKGIKPERVLDRYTHAFLSSLCYTENCYSCRYAQQERVSDISLGDSWGSELPQEEQEKGVSLILCQSPKGQELLAMANLHLEAVDVIKAVANNRQLTHPSPKPAKYDTFFDTLRKTRNFSKAVKKAYPDFCLRQDIKTILVKFKILRG